MAYAGSAVQQQQGGAGAAAFECGTRRGRLGHSSRPSRFLVCFMDNLPIRI